MSADKREQELRVKCPLCRGSLSVDAETGEVLDAQPHAKRAGSFDDALGAVSSAGERREEDFRRAFTVQEKREDLLEKKFRKAQDKASKDPNPPRNPLDD